MYMSCTEHGGGEGSLGELSWRFKLDGWLDARRGSTPPSLPCVGQLRGRPGQPAGGGRQSCKREGTMGAASQPASGLAKLALSNLAPWSASSASAAPRSSS